MGDHTLLLEKLRTNLKGYPDATVSSGADFLSTGDPQAFDRFVVGMIEHHLSQPLPKPLTDYPGSTRLVADLGLDSFTMIEMAFAFEDLFNAALPQEKLSTVVTIDDLRNLLRGSLPK